jgi:hypothetical protein
VAKHAPRCCILGPCVGDGGECRKRAEDGAPTEEEDGAPGDPPSAPASVAARRKARRRAGSRLATPGSSSSKRVVALGTAPPASPSASRWSLRERSTGGAADEGEDALGLEGPVEGECTLGDEETSDSEPRTATNAPPGRLQIRIRAGVARPGRLEVTLPESGAGCHQRVCDFRYADDMRRPEHRSMRVLLVEDEPPMADAIRDGLGLEAIGESRCTAPPIGRERPARPSIAPFQGVLAFRPARPGLVGCICGG